MASFWIKAPNILARSDIGFPFLVPLSKQALKGKWATKFQTPADYTIYGYHGPSKGGEIHHGWWYGMVLKSRYIKELFKPASGMVIELYRNNLFDPTDIGNFAPIFAYRNTVFQSGPDYSLALGVLRSSFVISGHAKLILLNKDN